MLFPNLAGRFVSVEARQADIEEDYVRLPGVGALILPYLGQKYDIGLYQVDQMWVYTSRGVGLIGPPIRLNCPPEITEITLVGA